MVRIINFQTFFINKSKIIFFIIKIKFINKIFKYKIYKRILEENIDGALILEDDFLLNYQNNVLKSTVDDLYHNGVELCLLGYCKMSKFDIFNYNLSNPITSRIKINNEFDLCQRAYCTTSGTVGYYINQLAARKIIDAGIPYYVADEWPLISSFNVSISHIAPCLVSESQAFVSLIEDQRCKKNKTAVKSNLSIIKDIAKVPFRFLKGCYWRWQKHL